MAKRLRINLSIVEQLEEAATTLREVLPALKAVTPNTLEGKGPLRRLEVYALGKLELALEEIKGETD